MKRERQRMKKAVIFCDGGSRGNPGAAAVGFVIQDHKGTILFEEGRFLGPATNNVVEYLALFTALSKALTLGFRQAECFLDSELVVKQLNGLYRVKDAKIKTVFSKVSDLARKFDKVHFIHIERSRNSRADELVNQALDEQIAGSPAV